MSLWKGAIVTVLFGLWGCASKGSAPSSSASAAKSASPSGATSTPKPVATSGGASASAAPSPAVPPAETMASIDIDQYFKFEAILTEAKDWVGAIQRGAVGFYNRVDASESPPDDSATPETRQGFCNSAEPMPSTVPVGGKAIKDTNWESGDAEGGWSCLRYSMIRPIHFQYTYSKGGPYKAPARGGKDPGKDGIEICAEADFIPGGPTTLVCIAGWSEKKEAKFDELFIKREYDPAAVKLPEPKSDATAKSMCGAWGTPLPPDGETSGAPDPAELQKLCLEWAKEDPKVVDCWKQCSGLTNNTSLFLCMTERCKS
ncbi:MAG: hypothetical protein U0271_26040 [Polyangiaceae bacterium]